MCEQRAGCVQEQEWGMEDLSDGEARFPKSTRLTGVSVEEGGHLMGKCGRPGPLDD